MRGQVDVVTEVRERTRTRLGSEPEGVPCLLYTSDAADERSSVDLGGRRIIKKKKIEHPLDMASKSRIGTMSRHAHESVR